MSVESIDLSFAVYSFEPAERMRSMGAPAFAPVAGTSLPWVSNTGRELFRAYTRA
jgi:hypothetical protein